MPTSAANRASPWSTASCWSAVGALLVEWEAPLGGVFWLIGGAMLAYGFAVAGAIYVTSWAKPAA